MKKFLCVLWIAMLLLSLFTGCEQQAESSADGTTNRSDHNDPTGSINTESTVPSSSSSIGQGSSGTSGDQPLVTVPLQQEPERNLYIFFENHNATIYTACSGLPFVSFYILSVDALNLDEVSLSLPIESSYGVRKKEITLGGTVDLDTFLPCEQNQFPYELYQCYAGKDFAKLAQLEQSYLAAKEAYEAVRNDESKRQAAWEAYQTAQNEYLSYYNAEKSAYESLTMDDLPKFHVYFIYASISSIIEGETFTEATLTIGTQTYTQNIGKITLKKRTGRADALDWYIGDYTFCTHGIMGEGNAPLPYNNGIHCVDNYFSFTADRAMTLSGLIPDNPEHKFLAALVKIQTFDGFASSLTWNLSDPIDLYEGDQVVIDVIYQDAALEDISYFTKVWGYLEYECADGKFVKLAECEIYPKLNLYIMYAILFQGMDLEKYYRDYYYPVNEPWREEFGG